MNCRIFKRVPDFMTCCAVTMTSQNHIELFLWSCCLVFCCFFSHWEKYLWCGQHKRVALLPVSVWSGVNLQVFHFCFLGLFGFFLRRNKLLVNRVPFFVVVVQVLMNCGLKRKKKACLTFLKTHCRRPVLYHCWQRAEEFSRSRRGGAVHQGSEKKSASTTIVQNILMKRRDLATDAINRVKQKILARCYVVSCVLVIDRVDWILMELMWICFSSDFLSVTFWCCSLQYCDCVKMRIFCANWPQN